MGLAGVQKGRLFNLESLTGKSSAKSRVSLETKVIGKSSPFTLSTSVGIGQSFGAIELPSRQRLSVSVVVARSDRDRVDVVSDKSSSFNGRLGTRLAKPQ